VSSEWLPITTHQSLFVEESDALSHFVEESDALSHFMEAQMNNINSELIYEEPLKRRLVPYFIEVELLDIPVDGTKTTSPGITIGPKPFVWTNLHIKEWGSIHQISIRDEGSAINFTKDRVHVGEIVRADSNEKDLAVEWTFPEFSTIIVEATNVSTEVGNIRLVFHGYLIFDTQERGY